MPTPVSALEHEPHHFIREVSPEAIDFYVNELSGIYLPGDFKEKYAETYDVKYWGPEDRLRGKFGRFALRHAQEGGDSSEEPLEDILVMGTTIGLSGIDRDGYMFSLRHYAFRDRVRQIFRERDLSSQGIAIDHVDYGSTDIELTDDGVAKTISIGGASADYGRATADGRQETCDTFVRLLGNGIEVLNADPEPRERQRIVD